METFEYAIFFSLSRLTWPLSISWIILACHYGYGGFINSILSAKSYIPITRLSYCAYLIHPVIMIWYLYTQETLFHGTLLTLVNIYKSFKVLKKIYFYLICSKVFLAISFIIVTFILAYIFSLLFELPFVAIERLIYRPKSH